MRLLLVLCLVVLLDPGHVKRVIDGDTFVLYHVGVPAEERVRVLGFDAPERGQPGFQAATDSLTVFLKRGKFELRACLRDSFGRYLGEIRQNGVLYMYGGFNPSSSSYTAPATPRAP